MVAPAEGGADEVGQALVLETVGRCPVGDPSTGVEGGGIQAQGHVYLGFDGF